jgi:hypothetical protein
VQRLVMMAEQAARAPAGLISDVFDSDATRQAAYDFLESPLVHHPPMQRALAEACARAAAPQPFAFVAIDGTTLTLTDVDGTKDFGNIGGRRGDRARGIKVISALGLEPTGVPLGIAAQRYWARPDKEHRSRREQKREVRERDGLLKETQHWVDVIEEVHRRFDESRADAWFVIDREGDAQAILRALSASGHRFTVRSSWNRTVQTAAGRGGLHDWMQRQPICGSYPLEVAAHEKRTARTASMHLRTGRVVLEMRIGQTRYVEHLAVNVVWAREVDTAPDGEPPLDWMLLTNEPVESFEAACLVVFSYTQRWRIEELHKAWKSGLCGIEQTQLRSQKAVIKWATILCAVAARAERLKHRSRQQPEIAATAELSRHEIRALLLLKRAAKKRTEQVPDDVPSLGQAVRWLADLGGYTGKSSGGPPGTITISRGLQRVRDAAAVLEQIERDRAAR